MSEILKPRHFVTRTSTVGRASVKTISRNSERSFVMIQNLSTDQVLIASDTDNGQGFKIFPTGAYLLDAFYPNEIFLRNETSDQQVNICIQEGFGLDMPTFLTITELKKQTEIMKKNLDLLSR
jgi:hypothetical protein